MTDEKTPVKEESNKKNEARDKYRKEILSGADSAHEWEEWQKVITAIYSTRDKKLEGSLELDKNANILIIGIGAGISLLISNFSSLLEFISPVNVLLSVWLLVAALAFLILSKMYHYSLKTKITWVDSMLNLAPDLFNELQNEINKISKNIQDILGRVEPDKNTREKNVKNAHNNESDDESENESKSVKEDIKAYMLAQYMLLFVIFIQRTDKLMSSLLYLTPLPFRWYLKLRVRFSVKKEIYPFFKDWFDKDIPPIFTIILKMMRPFDRSLLYQKLFIYSALILFLVSMITAITGITVDI